MVERTKTLQTLNTGHDRENTMMITADFVDAIKV